MKTTNFFILTAFTVSFLFGACSNSQEPGSTDNPGQPATGEVLESLPVSILQHAYANADFADYIFYRPSFSMNQDELGSIQQVLSTIASAPATLNPSCQPRGRVFFQQSGEDILVADIYVGEGCNYWVFVDGDKRTYGNLMTPQGVQYFTNNINQVLEMQRQAGQQ